MNPVVTQCEFRGNGLTLAADRWDPPTDAPRGAGDMSKGVVLLLHGGGQTRHSWRHTGARLAADGWTTLALDARGHGDSHWAPDGNYGIDALVADLTCVIDALGEKPVLVGASMGGMTSLIGQGENPDLARAVVLVDIAPKVETAGTAQIGAFMRSGLDGFVSLDDAAAAIAAYTPNRVRTPNPDGLRKNLRLREGRWYWHWDPAFLRAGDEPTRQTDAIVQYQRARAAAAAITVPTMLVRGAQSNVVSADGVKELLELIPHASVIDVAGAGHMVAGDDNDVFSGGLKNFLDDHVATRD
ncbi:hydrolase [Rhodococcus pyridinivorans KG-16]|uniref:Hydrolase n=1 Tax=Rhodococcus pyridinivorans KG-16 TaxID=1441730 RepID=A0A0V9UE89_9NOCA|nr:MULTISPECIES: alpha/beta hydrolase [Rhodococcus]KSZ56372.1 hydrolase [Rhodococcus pyridinivorans KG-16]MBS9372336.1 2-(acetamidomethylene)succinate hydrolase [Rhodococcus sp. B50]